MKIDPVVVEAAKAHARKEYPNESCGLLVDGVYLPCFNYAVEPARDFVIATEVWVKLRAEGRDIQAVIHSHPNGPIFPSARDMQGQVDTDVPWAIIAVFEDGRTAEPTIWGGPRQPIIGRTFIHGVSDCFSLVQDVYAAGRDALLAEGIDWPLLAHPLRPEPRSDAWWAAGEDLYDIGFPKQGFVEIPHSEARPGDAFMCKIKSNKVNHAGVLLNDYMICHHLPMRLSRREPAGIWARAAFRWVRLTSAVHA